MAGKGLLGWSAIGVMTVLLAACGEGGGDKTAQKMAPQKAVKAVVATTNDKFSPAQQKEISELVRKTLLERPEILQEAFAVLERREKEQQEKQKLAALAGNADLLFRSKTSPVAGNPNGDVTIVEFFDYNCPFCRKAFRDLETLMTTDDKVRVVFKEYPIFGGASQVAARAALAAEKQGKYFAFHKALLAGNSRVTEQSVFRIAKSVGLDVEKLKRDMKNPEIEREISETSQLAQALGVRGTPAFFVGDKMIPGAPRNLVELMKKHVADIRANGCKNC